MPRFIFRMTHYRNVEQQMQDGFLYSRNNPNGRAGYSICYEEIVNRRGTEKFTPEHESVNDYVPFYFSPATAMALAIKTGKVEFRSPEGINLGVGSNQHIVFYVADPVKIHNSGLKLWFTNIACNSAFEAEFYDDINLLEDRINWQLFDETPRMASIPEIGYRGACKWFFDRDEPVRYQNRKKERMAEFLVRDEFPVELIECIIVKNDNIRTQVEHWVNSNGRNIRVFTKPLCFY